MSPLFGVPCHRGSCRAVSGNIVRKELVSGRVPPKLPTALNNIKVLLSSPLIKIRERVVNA